MIVEIRNACGIDGSEETQVGRQSAGQVRHGLEGSCRGKRDIRKEFGGGKEGIDAFFGTETTHETDDGTWARGGCDGFDHVGDDGDSIGGKAAFDEDLPLEFGLGIEGGNGVEEPAMGMGNMVSQGVGETF